MQDWTQLVRDRLKQTGVKLSDSVIAELAAHLEEIYQLASSEGLPDAEAFKRAWQEIPDWRALGRDIQRVQSKEDSMNRRTRSLWLPALTSFLGATLSLMLCQCLGMKPHLVWIGEIAMPLYWPWLATLPLFGAAGAYLSRRAHGPTLAQFVASLAPALIMFTVMSLILPLGLAIDGFHFLELVAFGLLVTNWVVIPAVALLVGALPFLYTSSGSQQGATEV